MRRKTIIIGARGSLLSVCQAEGIIGLLKNNFPRYNFSLVKITTTGDRVKEWKRVDKGIFVKEIEDALSGGKIDIAVHSVKDLPSSLPDDLCLAAVPARENPCDVLLSFPRRSFKTLPFHARVGTSSLRRSSQILHARPDVRIEELRGNLDTRIRKLKEGLFDSIIVAAAGLNRLGFSDLYPYRIPFSIMLPAAGQGALGIEIRSTDMYIRKIVSSLNNEYDFLCIECERAFLKELGGGCRLPVAAYARIRGGIISLEAAVISCDGKNMIRISRKSGLDAHRDLGKRSAREILEKGGKEILDCVRKSAE